MNKDISKAASVMGKKGGSTTRDRHGGSQYYRDLQQKGVSNQKYIRSLRLQGCICDSKKLLASVTENHTNEDCPLFK